MVDALARIRGAIGYVDQAAVLHEKLAYALLRNQAGQFVAPDPASFQAAITGVDWAQQRDFFLSLTDPPMANAYPIMAVSFALVARYPKDPARARDLQSFFRWSLESGRDLAGAQDYLALSPQVVQLVEGYWEAEAR
jgi:phosphate transport system substrate-binding protein